MKSGFRAELPWINKMGSCTKFLLRYSYFTYTFNNFMKGLKVIKQNSKVLLNLQSL